MSEIANRVGWSVRKYEWTIKAGSSGLFHAVAVVTEFDGSALPDYSGWTAELKLFEPDADSPIITKNPTVTGDAVAKTLTFDLEFVPADTEDLAPESPVTLHGSLWLAHPGSTEQYSPARIFLKVEPHD